MGFENNKINRHIIIIFLVVIGIIVPKIFEFKYISIIQIILVASFISFYIIKSSNPKAKITNIAMIKKKNRMVESQKIMLELSNSMINVKSFEELLNIILVKSIEMIPTASHGSILVMNNEDKLEFKAIYGFEDDLRHILLNPEESYQWKATNGEFNGPIIIEDLQKYTNGSMTTKNFDAMNEIEALTINSTLSAPIIINNHFFGSINLDSKLSNMFTQEDANIMSYFSNQATIAIVNHQLYEKMLHVSRHDCLTQIYNRRYFLEIIEKQITENPLLQFTIVVIDLNKFKQINDLYGHINGDRVIQEFAKFFSDSLDEVDLFARYGGDEFIAVFFNKSVEETDKTMLLLKQASDERKIKLIDDKSLIQCSFSYGIADYPNEGSDLNKLMHIADNRMYNFKKSNKSLVN